MNYIITGGTGFIGTHLTNLILAEHPDAKVWNLDIVKPGTPNPVVKDYKPAVREGEKLGSTWVECDVRKPIENLPFTPTPDDVIFNFAAVHRTPGHEDIEYFETNILGAENVCSFAEKYGVRQMVFTSSIAPYGASEHLKTESTLPTPNTPYGISKLVAEKIHIAWQKGGEGRKLTIVRPGVVFGRGENGNFSRLYWGIRKPKPGLLLKAARDFNIDLSHSIMIGDSESDIQAGQNAGCKESILIETNKDNALFEAVNSLL